MSLGPSSYLVGKWFDATFNNLSFVVAQAYLKLHVGDPGPSGALLPAVYTTRPLVSFGTPSTAAGVTSILNDAQVQITSITGSEDASHYSLWDAASAGNFLGSGIINANAYTAGDTLTFAVGAISIGITVAN
jgi:hypothetical protein